MNIDPEILGGSIVSPRTFFYENLYAILHEGLFYLALKVSLDVSRLAVTGIIAQAMPYSYVDPCFTGPSKHYLFNS